MTKQNEYYEDWRMIDVLNNVLSKLKVLEYSLIGVSDGIFDHEEEDLAAMACYLMDVCTPARRYIEMQDQGKDREDLPTRMNDVIKRMRRHFRGFLPVRLMDGTLEWMGDRNSYDGAIAEGAKDVDRDEAVKEWMLETLSKEQEVVDGSKTD
jgi:hypothetical protein